MKIRIIPCKIAELDHRRDKRNYAHTYHYPATICVSKAILDIPFEHQIAILTHEVGHLMDKEKEPTEEGANKIVIEIFGVKIRYVPETPWGKRLQYVSREEAMKLRKYLSSFIHSSSLKYFRPSSLKS